jgi:cell division septum initiation protein DivIVA
MAGEPNGADGESPYLTPGELRRHELPIQAARGFHRGRTEELLNGAADTIERLNRDLAEIREARESWKRERERLESELEEEKKRTELLLGEAMLDAHKAAQALRAEAEADADAMRTEAEALLAPAREEAKRLLAEARLEALELVAEARAECERLAVEAEQYRLLADDVHHRSVDVLQRALETLGEDLSAPEAEVEKEAAPFRETGRPAARSGSRRRPRR